MAGAEKSPVLSFLGRKEEGCNIFWSGWQLKVCLMKLLFDEGIASLEEKQEFAKFRHLLFSYN